jgi:hypothetical protein
MSHSMSLIVGSFDIPLWAIATVSAVLFVCIAVVAFSFLNPYFRRKNRRRRACQSVLLQPNQPKSRKMSLMTISNILSVAKPPTYPPTKKPKINRAERSLDLSPIYMQPFSTHNSQNPTPIPPSFAIPDTPLSDAYSLRSVRTPESAVINLEKLEQRFSYILHNPLLIQNLMEMDSGVASQENHDLHPRKNLLYGHGVRGSILYDM